MASAAVDLAAMAAKPAVDAAKEQVKQASEDPVKWFVKVLTRGGLLLSIAGIGFMAVSAAAARQEQAYLNDIQDRLGLARTTAPTPPPGNAVPPPPTTQSLFYGLCNTLGNLDTSSAPNMISQLETANGQATALRQLARGTMTNADGTTTDTTTLPGSSDADLDSLFFDVADARGVAGNTVDHRTPGANPQDVPGDPAAWATVKGYIAQAHKDANTFAGDMGWPEPFADTSSGGSTGNPFWSGLLLVPIVGTVIQTAQGAAQSLSGAVGWLQGVGATASSDFNVIGHAIVNLPFLAWDGLGYAATWGAHTIGADLGPILLGVGLVMLAVGLLLQYFWPRMAPRVELVLNARGARFWNRVDKRLKIRRGIQEIWTQKSTEAAMHSANTEPVFVPAVVEAKEPPAALPTPPEAPKGVEEGGEGAGQAVTPESNPPAEPVPPPAPDTGQGPVPTPPAPPTPETSHEKGGVNVPAPPPEAATPPLPATEAEKEELLGEAPNLREQRMALERPRVKREDARREPTAEELMAMAGPPPTYEQREKLKAEAREDGYRVGRNTYMEGADSRVE